MASEDNGVGSQSSKVTRVLIIDDHKIVADAIATLLGITGGMEVVGRVYEADHIAEEIRGRRPDVVLCDLEMPDADPLEAASEAIRDLPGAKLMVLTAYPTDVHIARAARLGARAILTKHEPAETIVDAIQAVVTGHIVYSDEVRARLTTDGAGAQVEPKVLTLSPRELTIVRLVAQGMTTPQIAEKVFRSPKTVDNQIASAMSKTNSANRVELSRWAIREGLVQA